MFVKRIATLLVIWSGLTACGKKEEAVTAPAPVTPAAQKVSGAIDVGGVTRVSREAEGIGSTPELAVVAALQSVIAQVNGTRVASQMQSVRAGLDLSVGGDTSSVKAEAFVQRVLAASQGAITGFEILAQEEISRLDEETIARIRASDSGYAFTGSTVQVERGPSSAEADLHYKKIRSYWKVRVRAEVAQYRAPEDDRPKLVIAMPRTLVSEYVVADNRIAAADLANTVRARLSDILTQTNRFVVLDREFSAQIQQELAHISSGNVRVEDTARIGQQLATDLIVIPTIERFDYRRTARKLQMSDRELVSYSGGARVTLRILNATTGQVLMSESFDHTLASAEPTTLPRVIDGNTMSAEMMNALSGRIGAAIVTELFPVTVVAMNGDQVVLSQGGDVLAEGQRWQAIYLGEELTDPQTGRSLGRNEVPIGYVQIDRVSNRTSYGTLQALQALPQPFKPGAIKLKRVSEARSTAGAASASVAVPVTRPSNRGTDTPVGPVPSVSEEVAPARPSPNDKNW